MLASASKTKLNSYEGGREAVEYFYFISIIPNEIP